MDAISSKVVYARVQDCVNAMRGKRLRLARIASDAARLYSDLAPHKPTLVSGRKSIVRLAPSRLPITRNLASGGPSKPT